MNDLDALWFGIIGLVAAIAVLWFIFRCVINDND